jgi:hypothetical protein
MRFRITSAAQKRPTGSETCHFRQVDRESAARHPRCSLEAVESRPARGTQQTKTKQEPHQAPDAGDRIASPPCHASATGRKATSPVAVGLWPSDRSKHVEIWPPRAHGHPSATWQEAESATLPARGCPRGFVQAACWVRANLSCTHAST